ADPRIARLLDDHARTRIDQNARGEIDRLLRAVDDQNVFGRARDAARTREIARERLAQLVRATWIAVGEMALARAPCAARKQAAPRLVREVVVRGIAVAEVEARCGAPPAPRDAARVVADRALGVGRERRGRRRAQSAHRGRRRVRWTSLAFGSLRA